MYGRQRSTEKSSSDNFSDWRRRASASRSRSLGAQSRHFRRCHRASDVSAGANTPVAWPPPWPRASSSTSTAELLGIQFSFCNTPSSGLSQSNCLKLLKDIRPFCKAIKKTTQEFRSSVSRSCVLTIKSVCSLICALKILLYTLDQISIYLNTSQCLLLITACQMGLTPISEEAIPLPVHDVSSLWSTPVPSTGSHSRT